MACLQHPHPAHTMVLAVPKEKPNEEELAYAYLRFAQEGSLGEIFWGDWPRLPIGKFLEWTRKVNILGCYASPTLDQFPSLAGIGMVHTFSEIDGYRKLEIGMAFFRQYTTGGMPQAFCRKMIDWTFEDAYADMIYGITPAPHVAAVRFSLRMGFKQQRVRNYASWRGLACDAVFSSMTKEEWQAMKAEGVA